MNFNEIIRPFTAAVCLTKGIPMPKEPQLLDEKARRFLFDNVMSEMGEYILATTEGESIDALVDAIIYTTDTCLRFGIQPYVHANPVYEVGGIVEDIWGYAKGFLQAGTVDKQQQCLSFLLARLARGHNFDLTLFIEEVAKANLQKINADGTVTLNEKGKVMKPKDFISPDLDAVLAEIKNG